MMMQASGVKRMAVLGVVVVALAGCSGERLCKNSLIFGSAALGAAGVALAVNYGEPTPSNGEIAGGAIGGAVGGALLGLILRPYVCRVEEEAPPPPAPPSPPPARQKIETLSGPHFDFDRAVLKPEGRIKVDRVVTMMDQSPRMRVALEGHTDAIGSDAYNLRLSERRANAVRAYMVEQGVAADRLSVRGLGEANPVATNDTEEGRAQNRRVEVIAE